MSPSTYYGRWHVQRPAAINIAGTHAVGTHRHLEGFIGIGLRFQLREVLERGVIGYFVKLGDPAEHLAPRKVSDVGVAT